MNRWLPLLALAACVQDPDQVTETGNPELTLSYRARSSAPAEVAVTGDAPVRVQGLAVSIREVRMVEGADCDAPAAVEHQAPGFVGDLLTQPTAVRFEVAPGDYCRVRVRFDRADNSDIAGLVDHSMVVTGQRSDDLPYTISSRATPELELRSRGEPFDLSEAHNQLVLAFDAAAWLADVDLDAAVEDDDDDDDDDHITIDDDNNRDLLRVFEAAVVRSLELYGDEDGDGRADEDEDVLAAGD
jgi:hypothetical protein